MHWFSLFMWLLTSTLLAHSSACCNLLSWALHFYTEQNVAQEGKNKQENRKLTCSSNTHPPQSVLYFKFRLTVVLLPRSASCWYCHLMHFLFSYEGCCFFINAPLLPTMLHVVNPGLCKAWTLRGETLSPLWTATSVGFLSHSAAPLVFCSEVMKGSKLLMWEQTGPVNASPRL